MVWLPDGEKNEDMFIRFDRIHERGRQMDGHREVFPVSWRMFCFMLQAIICTYF